MTTTEKVRQNVYAIIKGKTEAEDGWKLELDIASFKSQYLTVITRVPAEAAAKLTVGQGYSMILERQNLKKDKTGAKPFDYYWGFVAAKTPAQELGFEESPPDAGEGEGKSPATRISIERQAAMHCAVELAGYNIAQGKPITARDVILTANLMAQWMRTGTVPVPPAPEEKK